MTPNDAAALASTGFPLRSSGAPIGALPAPGNLRATATDNEAEIELRCNTVKGASSYEWECRLHEGKPKALKARPARPAKPNSTTPSAARVRTATVWASWTRPLPMIRRRSWIWNTCGGSSTS